MRGSEARIRPLAHICTRAHMHARTRRQCVDTYAHCDTYAQAMHIWRMLATSNSLVRARLLSQSIASSTTILPGHHHDKPSFSDAAGNLPLNTAITSASAAITAVSASPPRPQNVDRSAPPPQANPASLFSQVLFAATICVFFFYSGIDFCECIALS